MADIKRLNGTPPQIQNVVGAQERGQVKYGNNGLAEHADLQKTAWDLGYDKQLSARIEQSLLQEAVAQSQDHVGATVKDFVDGAVEGLVAHGVGEDDAKMLLDAFVAKDLGTLSTADTGLQQAVAGRTDIERAAALTQAERFKSGNPEAVTIEGMVGAVAKGDMKNFLGAAKDMVSIYAAQAPEGSTVANFLSELDSELRAAAKKSLGDGLDVGQLMLAIQSRVLPGADFGDKISDWSAKL